MEVLSQPVRKIFRSRNLSQPTKHINNDISMNSSQIKIKLGRYIAVYRRKKMFKIMFSRFCNPILKKSLKTGNFRLFLIVTILKQPVKVHFSSKLTKNVFFRQSIDGIYIKNKNLDYGGSRQESILGVSK